MGTGGSILAGSAASRLTARQCPCISLKPMNPTRELLQLKPDQLTAYPKNARKHSPEQIGLICKSIEKFGFTKPVLVNEERQILAGHGAWMAAKKLELETIPVLVISGLSKQNQQAYVLADNKIAERSSWDVDILAVELKDLMGGSFDPLEIGFTDKELNEYLSGAGGGKSGADDIPDLPKKAISKPGDIWLLGKHKIICGDSTDPDTVKALLGDEKPHLMVTDPPYGVEYDADWRNHALRKDGSPIAGRAIGKVENDDRCDWSAAWALFPGDVAYVWHAGNKAHTVADSLINNGFNIRAQIIWSKSNMVIGRGDYHPKHEPCWYCVKKGAKGHWAGDRKQTTVWDIDKPQKSETGHSTQKPVECMRRPIKNNSIPGDLVYEPFSGSGTTVIACEETDRVCRAIELNPLYVDLCVTRWESFSGKKAVHAGTKKPFGTPEKAKKKG